LKLHTEHNDMSSGIFDYIPDAKPPVAETIAAGLLRQVEQEALRRAGEHIDGHRAFWESPEATPQQIADAMNGSAVLFLKIARGKRRASGGGGCNHRQATR
jgi:hypothetical protein